MTNHQHYMLTVLSQLAEQIVHMTDEQLYELDRKLNAVPGPQAEALSRALNKEMVE